MDLKSKPEIKPVSKPRAEQPGARSKRITQQCTPHPSNSFKNHASITSAADTVSMIQP
jgi:hypothetical protein